MGKYNQLAKENASGSYLGAGKHTVSVAAAEIKLGEDARPKWATKSISFRLENEDGKTFYDLELEPLTKSDGEENEMAIMIGLQNLINMGADPGEVESADDFAREAENFVMSGQAIGATVEINITEKPSNKMNPNTGNPYVNRNVYINKLVDAGGHGVEALASAMGADVF